MSLSNKGDKAEEFVVSLVKEFISQRAIFRCNHRVASHIHADKNGSLDRAGVDILIILNTGLAVPLQVGTDNKKHQRHRRRHPFIKFVFIVNKFPCNDNERRRFRNRLHKLIDNAIVMDRANDIKRR